MPFHNASQFAILMAHPPPRHAVHALALLVPIYAAKPVNRLPLSTQIVGKLDVHTASFASQSAIIE
jgi:hypothetical protein